VKGMHPECLKTVGGIRKESDKQLLSIRDLGRGSIAHLTASLGVTSVHVARQAENSDARPSRILCERQSLRAAIFASGNGSLKIAAAEIIRHSEKLMRVADGPMLQPFARRKSWW